MARPEMELAEKESVDPLDGAATTPVEPPEKPAWLRSAPCWALSALLHLVLFVAFFHYVTQPAKEAEIETIIGLNPRPLPRPRSPPIAPPDTQTMPKILTSQAPRGPVTPLSPPIFVPPEMPPTPPADLSVHETGLVPMGTGPCGGDLFSWRPRSQEDGDGIACRESRDAVEAALRWLVRHQSPDGSWRSRDFTRQCKTICGNQDAARYGDGRGLPEHDIGVTGLALLAFAGYGHTHRDGFHPEFVQCARKAVNYLKKAQVRSGDPGANGRFGEAIGEQWIYDHAIATLAMAELLVMSGDVIGLRKPVADAVKLCLHAQNDGFGWRYGIRPGDNDTSVTGWMVLALKTAKNARLDIPKEAYERAFAGALTWFNRATSTTGKAGYQAPGDEGSRLAGSHADPYPYSKDLSCMTAVAVLCRLFSGESRGAPSIRSGIKVLMQHPPRWQEQKGRALSTINMYYWYYGSYALFQYGGPEWARWNESMIKALLGTQRLGNIDEDGSWDPIGEWGVVGGRAYATAIGAMTLEVYYRYKRLSVSIQQAAPTAPVGPARKPR